MPDSLPTTREEANARIEASRKDLLEAIAGLTPEQMATPVIDGWTAKDLLSHVSSWDELMIADFRRLGRGHTPALAHFDAAHVDDWNALVMVQPRAFSRNRSSRS